MNKKTLLPIILLVFSFIVIGCSKSNNYADTVITGTIYTSETNQKIVSAIAIKDGVYQYVGDEEGVKAFIGDNTEVINLESGMAMPSFFEAHAHAELGGIGKLYQVELYDGKSMQDYEQIISNFVAEHKDLKILRGSGWGNGYTPKNGPTKDVLDRISTEIPIVLTSQDYHSIWVNSKALEIAGVDANTPDVEGGVIERDPVTKEPTGTFREKAQDLILSKLPDYTIEEYKNGILAYQEEALSYGVTSIFNPMLNMNTDGKNLFSALNELDKNGELKLNYFSGYQVLAENEPISNLNVIAELKKQANGNKFKLTTVKLFADGVVEGKTAYLLEDYTSDPGFRSVGLWEQDFMNEVCLKAQELGLQIHIHSIGDAAARLSINALDYVQKQTGSTNKRHAITHLQLVHKDDIKRMV